ncbi:MAG: hypothetical protein AAFQ68_15015 [Bacteroidota bacterium]
MNYLSIILLSLGMCLQSLSAQSPQKVVRITRELHEVSWYQEQAKAWQKELAARPINAAGWHSYYEANRALRNLTGEPMEDLAQIVSKMKQHVPESFEYSFLVFRNGGIMPEGQPDNFAFLEKAHQIDPSRTEVLEDFVTHYELAGDFVKRKNFNIKRFHANDIPYEILSYNYNVLMSLSPNAVIFTNGDNDTYPLWLLQDAMDVRTDVMVINCSLSFENAYLNRLLKHNGIPEFNKKIDTKEAFESYHSELRAHLLNQSNRPVYYALTVNPQTYEEIREKLYVVGLASQYSEKRFDNSRVLAENFEEKFRMEYLRLNLSHYGPSSVEADFAQAYLMPLLSLHRYYREEAEMNKAASLKTLIVQIASKTGREEEIAEHLNE